MLPKDFLTDANLAQLETEASLVANAIDHYPIGSPSKLTYRKYLGELNVRISELKQPKRNPPKSYYNPYGAIPGGMFPGKY